MAEIIPIIEAIGEAVKAVTAARDATALRGALGRVTALIGGFEAGSRAAGDAAVHLRWMGGHLARVARGEPLGDADRGDLLRHLLLLDGSMRLAHRVRPAGVREAPEVAADAEAPADAEAHAEATTTDTSSLGREPVPSAGDPAADLRAVVDGTASGAATTEMAAAPADTEAPPGSRIIQRREKIPIAELDRLGPEALCVLGLSRYFPPSGGSQYLPNGMDGDRYVIHRVDDRGRVERIFKVKYAITRRETEGIVRFNILDVEVPRAATAEPAATGRPIPPPLPPIIAATGLLEPVPPRRLAVTVASNSHADHWIVSASRAAVLAAPLGEIIATALSGRLTTAEGERLLFVGNGERSAQDPLDHFKLARVDRDGNPLELLTVSSEPTMGDGDGEFLDVNVTGRVTADRLEEADRTAIQEAVGRQTILTHVSVLDQRAQLIGTPRDDELERAAGEGNILALFTARGKGRLSPFTSEVAFDGPAGRVTRHAADALPLELVVDEADLSGSLGVVAYDVEEAVGGLTIASYAVRVPRPGAGKAQSLDSATALAAAQRLLKFLSWFGELPEREQEPRARWLLERTLPHYTRAFGDGGGPVAAIFNHFNATQIYRGDLIDMMRLLGGLEEAGTPVSFVPVDLERMILLGSRGIPASRATLPVVTAALLHAIAGLPEDLTGYLPGRIITGHEEEGLNTLADAFALWVTTHTHLRRQFGESLGAPIAAAPGHLLHDPDRSTRRGPIPTRFSRETLLFGERTAEVPQAAATVTGPIEERLPAVAASYGNVPGRTGFYPPAPLRVAARGRGHLLIAETGRDYFGGGWRITSRDLPAPETWRGRGPDRIFVVQEDASTGRVLTLDRETASAIEAELLGSMPSGFFDGRSTGAIGLQPTDTAHLWPQTDLAHLFRGYLFALPLENRDAAINSFLGSLAVSAHAAANPTDRSILTEVAVGVRQLVTDMMGELGVRRPDQIRHRYTLRSWAGHAVFGIVTPDGQHLLFEVAREGTIRGSVVTADGRAVRSRPLDDLAQELSRGIDIPLGWAGMVTLDNLIAETQVAKAGEFAPIQREIGTALAQIQSRLAGQFHPSPADLPEEVRAPVVPVVYNLNGAIPGFALLVIPLPGENGQIDRYRLVFRPFTPRSEDATPPADARPQAADDRTIPL